MNDLEPEPKANRSAFGLIATIALFACWLPLSFVIALEYLFGHADFGGSELDGAARAIAGSIGVVIESALFALLSSAALGLVLFTIQRRRRAKKPSGRNLRSQSSDHRGEHRRAADPLERK